MSDVHDIVLLCGCVNWCKGHSVSEAGAGEERKQPWPEEKMSLAQQHAKTANEERKQPEHGGRPMTMGEIVEAERPVSASPTTQPSHWRCTSCGARDCTLLGAKSACCGATMVFVVQPTPQPAEEENHDLDPVFLARWGAEHAAPVSASPLQKLFGAFPGFPESDAESSAPVSASPTQPATGEAERLAQRLEAGGVSWTELKQVAAMLRSLSGELEAAEQQVKILRTHIDSLGAQLTEANERTRDWEDTAAGLTETVRSQLTRIAELEARNRELESALDKFRPVTSTGSAATSTRAHCADCDRPELCATQKPGWRPCEPLALEHQLNEVRATRDKAMARVQELQGEVEGLLAAIQALESEVESEGYKYEAASQFISARCALDDHDNCVATISGCGCPCHSRTGA